MKKIIMMLLVLASMSVKVNAQWYVAGTAGIGYIDDSFQMILKPSVGYEIDNRWAVGIGVGVGVANGWGYGIIDPYVRFNCWNNEKIFIDVKGKSELWLGHGNGIANIGFVPSLRYVINDNWQIAGDFGLFGVQNFNDSWHPAFGITAATSGHAHMPVELTAIYKF